jgi:protein tyrosine/serine phosphatase
MNNIYRNFVIAALSMLFLACSPTVYIHGVPNLVKVHEGLYRSGQITTLDGWKYVASLGITRVVKLNFDEEGSDKDAEKIGLIVYSLPIEPRGDQDLFDNIANTFVHPDIVNVKRAEEIIKLGGGVLVHCTHGQDRTGYIVGRHRVLFNKWSTNDAYTEMLRNNFHPLLHGLHEGWEKFAKSVN